MAVYEIIIIIIMIIIIIIIIITLISLLSLFWKWVLTMRPSGPYLGTWGAFGVTLRPHLASYEGHMWNRIKATSVVMLYCFACDLNAVSI